MSVFVIYIFHRSVEPPEPDGFKIFLPSSEGSHIEHLSVPITALCDITQEEILTHISESSRKKQKVANETDKRPLFTIRLTWRKNSSVHSKVSCQSVFGADLPLPSSADDPLAVPGASDGRHTHVVHVVNDEHQPAAFWRKHPNLTVVPGCKTAGGIEACTHSDLTLRR